MKHVRVLSFLLVLLSVAIRVEAATATWDRNPESTVTGYILSYGTQSGSHPTSIDVGNVITYQFFPPPGQRYYVVVQAYNSSGTRSPESAEVVLDLTTTNLPPTFTQPANQSSLQNTAASLALIASDPEGTPITYNATGLPPGLSVNASTGIIAGTVTTTGTFTVTATASDGVLTTSRTFTWTVSAGTGSITVTLSPVDTYLNVNLTVHSTDTNLNTYTSPANRVANVILMKYDLSQIPATATLQSAVLQLALIDTDGVTADPLYNVSLHQILNLNPNIALANGLTADGATPWTPNTCCKNGAPMAQADLSPARWVTPVDLTLGFKTWDASSLVQAWRSAPATNFGLALNSDATKGNDRFRTFASMENATVANRPFLRITYTLLGTDTTPPTIALTAPANNATVSGSSVAVSGSASDSGGVAGVQFKLDGANLGAEDTTSPYSINWDTMTATNGTHTLTAVARDAAGNSATSAARTVTVSNSVTNHAPTLTQPANQSTAEGSSASLALVASDQDGNPLTFSATGLPGGLAINTSTGVISGAPTFTSAGAYTVTATVSDGLLSASRSFTWTITNTNGPPVLTQPANQVSMVGTAVSLALSATDPDGTPVTYQASGLPSGLTVNTTTGVIAGTLAANSVGIYTVTATASDGSLTASRTFTWSVSNTDAPVQGDFDGDGRDDPATYRASTGEWRVWRSSANYVVQTPIVWGAGSDVPVPADYDGDHRTDIAVYRLATGTWHVLLSSTNLQTSLDVVWGNASDRPEPIDYDGDGRADLALPRYGGFEILLSSSNYTTSVTVH
jgi:Bacterial Ig domain/Putative Ig domain